MNRSYDILDRPEILQVLFHPRREPAGILGSGSGKAVRIPVAPDLAVGGRIFAADPAAPAILYFHGNGEIAADYDGIAQLYRHIGLTLFVVDFRGYGQSGGSPTASALVSDAVAAYDRTRGLLAEAGLADGPLYVMGRSLGSAAAAAVAVHAGDGIRGLILESGFSDTFGLIERIGGLRLSPVTEADDGFDNAGQLAGVTVPTLVIHGQEDWIIPVSDGRALHEASAATHKTLLEIPGAGHNDLLMLGQSDYFGAIRRLVDETAV